MKFEIEVFHLCFTFGGAGPHFGTIPKIMEPFQKNVKLLHFLFLFSWIWAKLNLSNPWFFSLVVIKIVEQYLDHIETLTIRENKEVVSMLYLSPLFKLVLSRVYISTCTWFIFCRAMLLFYAISQASYCLGWQLIYFLLLSLLIRSSSLSVCWWWILTLEPCNIKILEETWHPERGKNQSRWEMI